MSKNLKVVVRVRAPTKSRLGCNLKLTYDTNKSTVTLQNESRNSKKSNCKVSNFYGTKVFCFDRVFGVSSSQEDVFESTDCRTILSSVKQGFNSTVIAYGQTGAGKTYTIQGAGDSQNTGIVPRFIKLLFEDGEEKNKLIKCSYVQIYNERCYDLLNPSLHYRTMHRGFASDNRKIQNPVGYLKLRWNSTSGFYLENMSKIIIQDDNELQRWYDYGNIHKITAEHKLNVSSSRSHTLFTLYVCNKSRSLEGRLCIVDLAGSERISSTEAGGVTLVESIGINKSLHALNKVILALSSQRGNCDNSHVPYRDSLLTSLLQNALGGNSITLLIACLSPYDMHYEENVSTLRYASQAKFIENKPVVNVDPVHLKINSMKKEILMLKERLAGHGPAVPIRQNVDIIWNGNERKLRKCLNTYSKFLKVVCNDNGIYTSFSDIRNDAVLRQKGDQAFLRLKGCLDSLEGSIGLLEEHILTTSL